MAKIPDVNPSETITDEWGNSIRDQTVQRYDSASDRTANHGSPEAGEVTYLADTGSVEVFHASDWRAFLPPGLILPYGGATAPYGFVLCNGGALSRTTYAALFAVIGTTFGEGNGSTTFNVPDMRGRFPFGMDTSGNGDELGETFGTKNHRHTTPNHSHTIAHTHTVNPPTTQTGTALGEPTSTGSGGASAMTSNHGHNLDIPAFTSGGSSAANSGSNNGGDTGTANPPALTLNYVIKL